MQKSPRYEVQTKYGWFSLDEGAYRDYLAGKLWITWPPEKVIVKHAAEDIPRNVSEDAIELRTKADRLGVIATLRQLGIYSGSVPYVGRLSDLSVDELNLTVRSSNGLKRANVMTFGDLKALIDSEHGILSVRNLGAKSAEEIKNLYYEECYLRLLPYEKAQYWQQVLDSLE